MAARPPCQARSPLTRTEGSRHAVVTTTKMRWQSLVATNPRMSINLPWTGSGIASNQQRKDYGVKVDSSPTFWAQIHIAGDVNLIRQTCHKWCTANACCVTVTPTTYVYDGGMQSGATIRFINYPKFPTTLKALRSRARKLAWLLAKKCCQYSYTVEDSELTYWRDANG